jgi:cell division protein FtsQ
LRRPAPLPASPEEPQSAPAKPVERRAVDEDAPIDLQPHDDVGFAVDAETDGLEPDALSARDVWRAARARRKRLRAEIRRFTQRSRRRRMIWLVALGAVVLLIGGSVIAAYSPLFAVEKITVVGASALDPAAIESALEDQVGRPLALVDDSEVKAALMAFPLIETFALEAKPPHDLTLRIVERTPIGVLESDAGYTLVDSAGVALSTTEQPPEGQPVLRVEGGPDSDAFESVGLVVRSLPADVRATLSEVTASTLDDVTLKLSTGLTVVWGSAEDSILKSATLSSVLTARPDARTVDVSSYQVPVVG